MILDLFDDLINNLEDSPYYSKEGMDLLKKTLKGQGDVEDEKGCDFKKKIAASRFNKNIYRTNNKYVLEIVLAGYEKNELNVSCEGNELKICTNDSFEKRMKSLDKKDYIQNEYTPFNFEMSFTLPKNVDKKNISVALKNGILKVEAPLLEDKKENIRISIL